MPDVPAPTSGEGSQLGLPVMILLSTFNGERYLSAQLDSLLVQTHGNWRLLVRDDGSRDGSVALVQSYAARDPRIELWADEHGNLGVAQSFSRLLQACRQRSVQRVMLCDQDDIWHADKIAVCLQAMAQAEREHPSMPVLVHTDLVVVDADDRTLHSSMWSYSGMDARLNQLQQLLVQNTVTGCTAMLNSALLQRLGPLPPEALLHDWWIALVAAATGHVRVLPQATIRYRQHGRNVAGIRPNDPFRGLPMRLIQTAGGSAWRGMRDKLVVGPSRQAAALLDAIRPWIDIPQQELLQSFGAIDSNGWVARKRLLIEHGIRRQRFRHNCSLLLLA